MRAYDHLELLAASKAQENGLPHAEAYLLSIAISLRRVGDALVALQADASATKMEITKIASAIDISTWPHAFMTKTR